MLFNAEGNNGGGVQQIFYENMGDGSFELKPIEGLEHAKGDKVLMTDFDGDQIDDVIILSPLAVWKGNGDFTFTDVSAEWLGDLTNNFGTITATDIDFDNDGDLDVYLAKGHYYFSIAENNSVDFNAAQKRLDARISGSQGTLLFEVTSEGDITFSAFDYVNRNGYNEGFPLFLGADATSYTVGKIDDTLVITQAMANGWPEERTVNGFYIGYVGDNVWKLETVRDQDIYWSIHFTLDNLISFTPEGWASYNRNMDDILLENTGTGFVNVTDQWNIPKGGNHWGVTRGDFNNDTYQDLFIYRCGYLKNRSADYILLNTGNGSFEMSTSHAASSQGERDHGDMGQAFDYDLDGDVDIFSGDDEYGLWHLYENGGTDNNYSLVQVNYSPRDKVDQYSATVTIHTPDQVYFQRVGSAGEAHSQSLLSIVHFGMGQMTQIDSVVVRWRNGEMEVMENPPINQLLSTKKELEPTALDDVSKYLTIGEFYPNPSEGIFHLDYTSDRTENVEVSILDVSGKLIQKTVEHFAAGKGTLNLDLSALKDGMYIVIMGNDNAVSRQVQIKK
jgi:hypothetical protein